jgi:hypothetical protein
MQTSDNHDQNKTMPAGGPLYSPIVFNTRSRQRFRADRTRQLLAHLGRPATYTEQVLIARIVSNEWDLRRLDHRLDKGEELSGHAARLRLALENRLRLDLQVLGFEPKPAKTPLLADVLADLRRGP